jgi:hypothetical protein
MKSHKWVYLVGFFVYYTGIGLALLFNSFLSVVDFIIFVFFVPFIINLVFYFYEHQRLQKHLKRHFPHDWDKLSDWMVGKFYYSKLVFSKEHCDDIELNCLKNDNKVLIFIAWGCLLVFGAFTIYELILRI